MAGYYWTACQGQFIVDRVIMGPVLNQGYKLCCMYSSETRREHAGHSDVVPIRRYYHVSRLV